jgi:Response regulator containing CheY-like receiver, AAA-type ATPase, and DNA-binding domains
MLEIFLSAVGYRVLTAADGRVGAQIALDEHVDAVVLDYEMPDLNGVEVAQILKSSHPQLPIIMYSAHPPEEAEGAPGLVDGYVQKDRPQALIGALARALERAAVTPPKRRFPRFPVRSLFSLQIGKTDDRSETTLQGRMLDLAEGGLGGTLDREIAPGQVVALKLDLPQCQLGLELRARVRYQNADSHGFEFFDLTGQQQDQLRRCIQTLAVA